MNESRSHMNHLICWDERVTYEWVMSHMNESCHIWMSHVTYKWVISHTNESRHVWMSHGHIWIISSAEMKEEVALCGNAVCYSVLQCVVVCCSVMQHVAVCCSMLQLRWFVCDCASLRWNAVCCREVQRVAGKRSVLMQCVDSVCCSVLQCVAVCWCSVLQCDAVCCTEA